MDSTSSTDIGLQAQKKRRRPNVAISMTECVFCNEPFSSDFPQRIPDISNLGNLFSACRKQLDETAFKLLNNEQDIVDGNIQFRYHKNCRSSYISNYHLKFKGRTQAPLSAIENIKPNKVVNTQLPKHQYSSRGLVFNWETNCFICGSKCSPKKGKSSWSVIEQPINNKGEDIYKRILDTAFVKNDEDVINRLLSLPNEDLVCVRARYHRGKNCLSNYFKECNKGEENTVDDGLQQLIEEYRSKIMVDKQVFLLTTLRDRYEQISNGMCGNNTRCRPTRFKSLLQQHWTDLSFIERPGETHLVCSCQISVGEALCKANQLMKELHDSTDTDFLENTKDIEPTETDSQLVHRAIGVLKKHITSTAAVHKGTSTPNKEYIPADELSLEEQMKFVDPLLYKAIGWLADEHLYKQAADLGVMEPNCRYLSVVCDLTNLATSIITPKHLGLGITLHHDYGSKKLINLMHSLGYCISYVEVRHFLTSAAKHINSLKSHIDHSYIPPEIVPIQEGGDIMVAASDNWDHEERSVTGKKSTHAMTSIIVQAGTSTNSSIQSTCIKRSDKAALDVTDVTEANLSHVEHYKKPASRPEPSFTPPVSIDEIQISNDDDVKQARVIEMIYNMVRSGLFHTQNPDPEKTVPSWGPFHANCSSSPTIQSTIAYTPMIMAPPSDLSTVYTTLLKLKGSFTALGQQYAPIFFDMGLLCKALEIAWAGHEQLTGVIPCDGGMHLLMSVFAAIGNLYGDAGIKQLLSDSGIFGPGTVNHIMSGKDFDRALYVMKLLDETLSYRFYMQFLKWCNTSGRVVSESISTLLSQLEAAIYLGKDPSSVLEKLQAEVIDKLLPLLETFTKEGCEKSPTFRLWSDFLVRVLRPLKMFISATRNGDWTTYQSAKVELLPLLFAANRTNYSRYMPAVILMMNRLPEEILSKFKDGAFVAHLSTRRFNGTWLDYTLEATENKDLKGPGGIIGLTLKDTALLRYFMARPVTAKYSQVFMETTNRGQSSNSSSNDHHDAGKATQSRWNLHVDKLCRMFDESYIDPFDLTDAPTKLVNFASGAVATQSIESSLLHALDKGFTMAKTFVTERFIPEPETGKPKKSIYAVLPRSGVQTMAQLHKHVKVNGKTITMDAEVMYLRLLAVNSIKRVPITRLMSFENSPVPLSMFNQDGSMVSCTKSEFMHKLEDLVIPKHDMTIPKTPGIYSIVHDGHAVIQMLGSPSTKDQIDFKEMAHSFFNFIMNSSKGAKSIHVVFDRYLDDSIKSQTREKRSDGMSGRVHHVKPDVHIPSDWKSFLSNPTNKTNLARVYTEYMKDQGPLHLEHQQQLYISGGQDEQTIVVMPIGSATEVVYADASLCSNHEEADTRIILHAAAAAASGSKCVIISSPDTDVFVLLLHHFASIGAEELYFRTGREGKHINRKRNIPVHIVYNKLSVYQHKMLLSVYCISGCDSVSSFFGHGKKTAFRILMQQDSKIAKYQQLSTLGKETILQNDEVDAAIRFVGAMYGKVDCTSLNLLRCERAARNTKSKALPPTEDSFRLHLWRCVFQLHIWRLATVAFHMLPDPMQFGYERIGHNGLCPKMMSQTAAAPELLNNLVCNCNDRCQEQCPCYKNQQCCTAACKCFSSDEGTCCNTLTMLTNDVEEEEDDSEDDDEDEN